MTVTFGNGFCIALLGIGTDRLADIRYIREPALLIALGIITFATNFNNISLTHLLSPGYTNYHITFFIRRSKFGPKSVDFNHLNHKYNKTILIHIKRCKIKV